AWAEKAAICLVSGISVRHNSHSSELFAVLEKLARQARSYRITTWRYNRDGRIDLAKVNLLR
ncbi:MAG: hypothetical protein KDI41_21245, partial [Pseudomonadales bacterium]|nr:hypothetical protein [Pseudomonadales bacterium]